MCQWARIKKKKETTLFFTLLSRGSGWRSRPLSSELLPCLIVRKRKYILLYERFSRAFLVTRFHLSNLHARLKKKKLVWPLRVKLTIFFSAPALLLNRGGWMLRNALVTKINYRQKGLHRSWRIFLSAFNSYASSQCGVNTCCHWIIHDKITTIKYYFKFLIDERARNSPMVSCQVALDSSDFKCAATHS